MSRMPRKKKKPAALPSLPERDRESMFVAKGQAGGPIPSNVQSLLSRQFEMTLNSNDDGGRPSSPPPSSPPSSRTSPGVKRRGRGGHHRGRGRGRRGDRGGGGRDRGGGGRDRGGGGRDRGGGGRDRGRGQYASMRRTKLPENSSTMTDSSTTDDTSPSSLTASQPMPTAALISGKTEPKPLPSPLPSKNRRSKKSVTRTRIPTTFMAEPSDELKSVVAQALAEREAEDGAEEGVSPNPNPSLESPAEDAVGEGVGVSAGDGATDLYTTDEGEDVTSSGETQRMVVVELKHKQPEEKAETVAKKPPRPQPVRSVYLGAWSFDDDEVEDLISSTTLEQEDADVSQQDPSPSLSSSSSSSIDGSSLDGTSSINASSPPPSSPPPPPSAAKPKHSGKQQPQLPPNPPSGVSHGRTGTRGTSGGSRGRGRAASRVGAGGAGRGRPSRISPSFPERNTYRNKSNGGNNDGVGGGNSAVDAIISEATRGHVRSGGSPPILKKTPNVPKRDYKSSPVRGSEAKEDTIASMRKKLQDELQAREDAVKEAERRVEIANSENRREKAIIDQLFAAWEKRVAEGISLDGQAEVASEWENRMALRYRTLLATEAEIWGTSPDRVELFKTSVSHDSIVYMQNIIRSFLKRKEQRNAVNLLRRREQVLREIVASEETYVRNLELIVSLFLRPLRSKRIVDASILSKIFLDVEVMAQLHKQLFDELSQTVMEVIEASSSSDGGETLHEPSKGRRRSHSCAMHSVADIFLNFVPTLKIYGRYCGEYINARETLVNETKTNAALSSFLSEVHSNPSAQKNHLDSFLIMPVQRLPRYELLLGQLIKYTDAEHVDYGKLEEAKEQIVQLVEFVDSNQESAALRRRFANARLGKMNKRNSVILHDGSKLEGQVLVSIQDARITLKPMHLFVKVLLPSSAPLETSVTEKKTQFARWKMEDFAFNLTPEDDRITLELHKSSSGKHEKSMKLGQCRVRLQDIRNGVTPRGKPVELPIQPVKNLQEEGSLRGGPIAWLTATFGILETAQIGITGRSGKVQKAEDDRKSLKLKKERTRSSTGKKQRGLLSPRGNVSEEKKESKRKEGKKRGLHRRRKSISSKYSEAGSEMSTSEVSEAPPDTQQASRTIINKELSEMLNKASRSPH